MKKLSIFLCICLLASETALGQTKIDKLAIPDLHNSIYIGYLGDNTFFGLNYERFFILNDRLMLAGKIGLAYNGRWSAGRSRAADANKKLFPVPHYVTINSRSRKNFFETGLGGLAIDSRYVALVIAGYRVHPVKKGRLNFRNNMAYPVNGNFSFLYFPFGLSSGIVF